MPLNVDFVLENYEKIPNCSFLSRNSPQCGSGNDRKGNFDPFEFRFSMENCIIFKNWSCLGKLAHPFLYKISFNVILRRHLNILTQKQQ